MVFSFLPNVIHFWQVIVKQRQTDVPYFTLASYFERFSLAFTFSINVPSCLDKKIKALVIL